MANFLHLARPLAPVGTTAAPTTAPVTVTVQPQAIFSILDHASRRPADQERVIGTLLGVRSEDGTEVEIRNCYAVPHTETAEQVEVDMDYQKRMLELHLKASPKEVLIGWYATSSELNTFSALIQNFYSQQGEGTWPHPAVHLTVNTVAGQDPRADTYISAPIGVTAERAADSCLFIPVPHEIKYGDADRSGLELIAGARDREDRSQLVQTDIETLERAIEQVLEMLERVANYVSDVLDEEAKPSSALGQFLMNTLSVAPKVDAEDIERDFNNHIQDVLLVSYLANTIRTQMDLSHRLSTAALTMGEGKPKDDNKPQQKDRQRGGQREQQ
ncbi:Eukaryotic translation initiation factor 3 subunit F [Cercospora zeina]